MCDNGSEEWEEASLLHLFLEIFEMVVKMRVETDLVTPSVRPKAGGVRRLEYEFLKDREHICSTFFSHT